MGPKRWEQKKQWWKRIRAGQKPSTPTAADTDEAEVDTDKAKVQRRCKGAKKGGMYMLYGDSAQGLGGSHMTLTVRAPHARMTQALARVERACGAIGRAAVKLAEEVDACIEFELTQRRVGIYKDMPSEQSIEQPTDIRARHLGRCVRIGPYDGAQVGAFPCSLCGVEATATSTCQWCSLVSCR